MKEEVSDTLLHAVIQFRHFYEKAKSAGVDQQQERQYFPPGFTKHLYFFTVLTAVRICGGKNRIKPPN